MISLPTDEELTPEHSELLDKVPALNIFRMLDRYGPREATEVILLVSYYNMVSCFLESTRVPLEDEPADIQALLSTQ